MRHDIIMPDLGQTAAEGKIVRWLKKPGDPVAKGDMLLEVETDKVTMEVESYRKGYLRAHLVEEGQMAGAMSPIAVLTDEPEEAYDGSPAGDTGRPAHQESGQGPISSEAKSTTAEASVATSGRPAATPAAKARAREVGIDLRELAGTGPDGLITRSDVERAQERPRTLQAASPMAALTARSAAEIPHFYVTRDVDVSGLLAWRERWNAAHPDLHASVNDVIVRAAMMALRDVPKLNVRYRDGKIERRAAGGALLVVAVESGLTLVPVAGAASSSWEDYLSSMHKILEGVRQRGLVKSASDAPALAISNLGMFGVKQFTAIIPPESAAALAIGAVREEVIVKDQQMRIAKVCSLTLSSDHRVIDGITAAKFLERIQAHLNSL